MKGREKSFYTRNNASKHNTEPLLDKSANPQSMTIL